MKASNQKLVLQAVQKNIRIYVETKGEGCLVGLDDFTEEMETLFDNMFGYEVERLNAVNSIN